MSYRVPLCGICFHPGGQHWSSDGRFEPSDGCHLCDCAGYEDGHAGSWSDEQTVSLRQRRRSKFQGKAWPVRVQS